MEGFKTKIDHLSPQDLGYSPDTLKPVLVYDQNIIFNYPDKVAAMKVVMQRDHLGLKEAKDKVTQQFSLYESNGCKTGEDEARLTPDGRLIDASNILKPALARGKIRCIGATTTSEYKKFIENDSALERRFQKRKYIS